MIDHNFVGFLAGVLLVGCSGVIYGFLLGVRWAADRDRKGST
jgi:hypothetical protein